MKKKRNREMQATRQKRYRERKKAEKEAASVLRIEEITSTMLMIGLK